MQQQLQSWRDWLTDHMGIDEAHKESVYLEISQGATLMRVNYWLELVAAAGIATLGLALNSPAVIIGAMLISPLMGPISSMGLSLASGDFILCIRSITNLILSSLFAILFTVLLVYFLPFKEVNSEIAGRTQPNLLDLGVALFSGAIGAISTCKPMKGVINSIPGVAIAVALIPPLCVIGYGIGISISHSFVEGIRVATGAGLLFITNIVAITFTSMLVFLSLHIDTDRVKEKVKEWIQTDRESQVIQNVLSDNKILRNLRPAGSLQGRLIMVLGLVLLLTIPLSASIDRLTREISGRNEENRIRRVVREVWNRQIAFDGDGETRSLLNQLSIQRRERELILNLSAFTNKPLTPEERQNYRREIATILNKPVENVSLNLVEVPTAQFEPPELIAPELTLQELQSGFITTIDRNISAIRFPGEQELVEYRVISNRNLDLTIQIIYLAETRMSSDAETLLARSYAQSIPLPRVDVQLEFVDGSFRPLATDDDGALLPATTQQLDRLAAELQNHPTLSLEISGSESLSQAFTTYLVQTHQILPDRIVGQEGTTTGARLRVSQAREVNLG